MTYNHAFTLAFSVSKSSDPTGANITAEQLAESLRTRIADLLANGEMLEAVGLPFDTYEEENTDGKSS
jgi:hypothetical protein